MKTRTQKIISLVLVLMMLVSMVPMGIFTASAEGVTPELAAGLANYANTKEFVINSVDDWKAISSFQAISDGTDKDGNPTYPSFSGKTIKLGTDIDAQNEALPVLISKGSFYGTFDGNGKTVKNATVTGTGHTALIAAALGGGKITNVKFDNITVSTSSGHIGLIAGHNSLWADCEISQINAINITIHNSGTGNTGCLIGNHANNGYAQTVTKINIQGTVEHTAASGSVGGVVGSASVGGVTKWSSIYSDVIVIAKNYTTKLNDKNETVVDQEPKAAGFAGFYSANAGKLIELENIYVGGALDRASRSTSASAMFICTIAGASDVDNIVLDVNMSKAFGNSVILGSVSSVDFTYSNVYSIYASNKGSWSNTSIRWTGLSVNEEGLFNGKYIPWATGDAGYDSLTYISSPTAAAMVVRDANGYLSSFNEPTKTALEIALEDYDNRLEFVINNAAEWNYLASQGKSFAGKTIKLGADIDAANKNLQILTGSDVSFTFDGAGYTVKNVGSVASPNANSLISPKMKCATVKNVNFDNVIISTSGAVGIISPSVNGYETAPNLVENIKVTNCKITSTANAAGTIVGGVAGNNDSTIVTFRNINIDANTVVSGAGFVGGITGSSGHSGELTFENIHTAAQLIGTGEPASQHSFDNAVGGIVGREHSNPAAVTNFRNVIVEGSLNSTNTTTYNGVMLGGLAGAIRGGSSKTVNISNVIIACDFYSGHYYSDILSYFEGANTYVNYDNVYVKENYGTNPKAKWQITSASNTVYLNGVGKMEADIGSAPAHGKHLTDLFIFGETPIANFVKFDDTTGFIVKVRDLVEVRAYQASTVNNDGKYAIRFIAMSQLTAEDLKAGTSVAMQIDATFMENGVSKTLRFKKACTLYDGLTVYSQYGIAQKTVYASEYNAEKLIGLTIYDIPTGEDITFSVKVIYTNIMGEEITSATATSFTIPAAGPTVSTSPAN